MTTIEATHASADKAINQASEFPEANLFDLDLALQEGLARADAAWGDPRPRAARVIDVTNPIATTS